VGSEEMQKKLENREEENPWPLDKRHLSPTKTTRRRKAVSQSGNIRNTHRWIGFDWILAAGTVTTNQNPAQNRAREPRRPKQNVNFQISVGTEISR